MELDFFFQMQNILFKKIIVLYNNNSNYYYLNYLDCCVQGTLPTILSLLITKVCIPNLAFRNGIIWGKVVTQLYVYHLPFLCEEGPGFYPWYHK